MITIGNSKAFIIPTAYRDKKMVGGLENNRFYDIDITESLDDEIKD